jgi:hypothetical protein
MADYAMERAGSCMEAVTDGVLWLQVCASSGPDNFGMSVDLFDETDTLLELFMYPYIAHDGGFRSMAVVPADRLVGQLYSSASTEQLVAGYEIRCASVGNSTDTLQALWSMHTDINGTTALRFEESQAGASALQANSIKVVYSAAGDKINTTGQVSGARWNLEYQAEANEHHR